MLIAGALLGMNLKTNYHDIEFYNPVYGAVWHIEYGWPSRAYFSVALVYDTQQPKLPPEKIERTVRALKESEYPRSVYIEGVGIVCPIEEPPTWVWSGVCVDVLVALLGLALPFLFSYFARRRRSGAFSSPNGGELR